MLETTREIAKAENELKQAGANKKQLEEQILKLKEDGKRLLGEEFEEKRRMAEQDRQQFAGQMKAEADMLEEKRKRAMFDMAMEAVAEDVANKVGEMERFMELSSNFMQSIDLQNGIFEEEGLKMLEKWEQESTSLLLGEEKSSLLLKAMDENEVLDLNAPVKQAMRDPAHKNQYDNFFN